MAMQPVPRRTDIATSHPGRSLPSGRADFVRGAVVTVLATLALFVPVAGSMPWVRWFVHQASVDGSANSRAATSWVLQNVDSDAVVVTDDYIWPDLVRAGYKNTVWLWKVDTDPEVMTETLPDGYASIDYIVLAQQPVSTLNSLPTLKQAIANSVLVAAFGEIEIRHVEPAHIPGPGRPG
jgi:hypothetical protein